MEGLLTHAKAQVTEATARRAVVTDKCKTLFTFNTALLALITVFQAKTADLHSWENVLFYLAVIAFVISLLVVWTYYDVGGESVTPMNQDLVGLTNEDLTKSLINSNLRSPPTLTTGPTFLWISTAPAASSSCPGSSSCS